MVPAMEAGRIEDQIEPAKAHPDIAVGEDADESGQPTHPDDDVSRCACEHENGHSENHALERIHEVEPPGVEEPQSDRAMVHGVKPPERQPDVSEPVRPVESEFCGDESKCHLGRQRPSQGPHAATTPRSELFGDAEVRQCDHGDLHGDFRENCMREIGDFLSVRLEPLGFVRTDSFQAIQGQREPEVGDVKREGAPTVRDPDSEAQAGRAEEPRPKRIIQQCAEPDHVSLSCARQSNRNSRRRHTRDECGRSPA